MEEQRLILLILLTILPHVSPIRLCQCTDDNCYTTPDTRGKTIQRRLLFLVTKRKSTEEDLARPTDSRFGCFCISSEQVSCLPLYCVKEKYYLKVTSDGQESLYFELHDSEKNYDFYDVKGRSEDTFDKWLIVNGGFQANGTLESKDYHRLINSDNVSSECICKKMGSCRDKEMYCDSDWNGKVETAENCTIDKGSVDPVGLIITVPFLLMTFFIYSILPEYNNVMGIELRIYVGCLIVSYTSMASQVTGSYLKFLVHFPFLASFLWLNVMWFDVWWSFMNFPPILEVNPEERSGQDLFLYSIYAWGFSLIQIRNITICPNYREKSICWLKTPDNEHLNFYIPMALTILSNVYFLISTGMDIIHHNKETANNQRGADTERQSDIKQWFNLHLKMFILMVTKWTIDGISCLTGDTTIGYIAECVNGLHGMIIFIIFVCNENTRQILHRHFRDQMAKLSSGDSTVRSNGQNSQASVHHPIPLSNLDSPIFPN